MKLSLLFFIAVASCGGSTVAGSSEDHDAGAGASGCLLAKDPGMCEAAFSSYWNNPQTGVCEPFLYGGCGGNANRFMSLEACQKACRGGDPELDKCSVPTDCVLTEANCCQPCGEVTAQSLVALNRSSVGVYSTTHGCDRVDCAACPEQPPQMSRQFFFATCQAGQCAVIDVRKTGLDKCSDKDTCVLRNGLNCCEACSGTSWVALNANAHLAALVCGDNAPPCPPCVPPPPDPHFASCIAGSCEVTMLMRSN